MGTTSSRDTRRISFDNTFALSPALAVVKSHEDATSIMELESFGIEKSGEFMRGNLKSTDVQENCELDYWKQRIEDLKKEHQSINSIVESEYIKTLEKTNNLCEMNMVTEAKIQKVKPCFDWRARIMRCYEDNPHQPLVCSSIVQAFSNSVATCKME